jgi:hypothetical protein
LLSIARLDNEKMLSTSVASIIIKSVNIMILSIPFFEIIGFKLPRVTISANSVADLPIMAEEARS